jgi:hypothetical protein
VNVSEAERQLYLSEFEVILVGLKTVRQLPGAVSAA